MILSYNPTANKNKDDSSEDSNKEDDYKDLHEMIKDKHKIDLENKSGSFQNNSRGWEENNMSLSNSSQISKIEHKNCSINSSLQGLSHGEDCIQKDVLLVIEEDSMKKSARISNTNDYYDKKSMTDDEKIIDISADMSLNSQKSKNYILKSSLVNNNSQDYSNKIPNLSNKKGLSYFLNKPKSNEEKIIEPLLTKVPLSNIANSTMPKQNIQTFIPQQKQQQHQQIQGSHNNNQMMYMMNDLDAIANQMDFLSLKHKTAPMNNQPIDYQQPSMHQQLTKNIMNNSGNGNINGSGNMSGYQMQEDSKMQFFNNKQNKPRFEIPNDNDLITNCIHYAKEQTGCRLLQKKIDDFPLMANDVFYPAIKTQFIELSCDSFGNYFIQRLIDSLPVDKLEDLLQKQLTNSFKMMCFDPHGTRVIQKIFEKVISDDKLRNLYTILLQPHIKDFIIDHNASHIIIQFVSLAASPYNDFVIDFLVQNLCDLATQKHSCCALQKCIEYVNDDQKKILYNAVANNSFKLFTDQYGNYVVQFVITAKDFEVNHIIMINFLYNFEQFSIQKFSSNVIEKCLSYCSDETKQMIVEHICNPQIVHHLLYNMYGNYVLQKGMTIAQEPYRSALFEYVGNNLEKLQLISFGPKLYNRLITTFPELSRFAKSDKGMGGYQRKAKIFKQNKSNMGSSPIIMQQPQMNSFSNYGSVYYQPNQMYNPYQQQQQKQQHHHQQQQQLHHHQNLMHNQNNTPINNYAHAQYIHQALGQTTYYPLNNSTMNNINTMNSMNTSNQSTQSYIKNNSNHSYVNNNYYN